jgi:hypothetical protein
MGLDELVHHSAIPRVVLLDPLVADVVGALATGPRVGGVDMERQDGVGGIARVGLPEHRRAIVAGGA